MKNLAETALEIDLEALIHNFKFIKSIIDKDTKLLAVVKAFAYGSDSVEIARCLASHKVDYFAVAYVHEGVSLREAGIKTPILVLHPQGADLKRLLRHGLEPSLYNFRIFNAFLTAAREEGYTDYPIHIKFNTGLNRLGFSMNDIEELLSKYRDQKELIVKSVFSHLAATEDPKETDFTRGQIQKFEQITAQIDKELKPKPIKHILNSSGILNYPEAQYDMVRSGIALYGFGNEERFTKLLKPVLRLKTTISQIHTIERGESVGYNRGFIAKDTLRTATLPLGHADGIHRAMGNGKGFVWIHDQKARIIGNVCMDMIMVDVSEIQCKEGDEVILFENQAQVNELAASMRTISYEMITAISQRVKRILK